jgi:hypothetical protein
MVVTPGRDPCKTCAQVAALFVLLLQKIVFFPSLRIYVAGQVLENEVGIFGTCIAGRECPEAKESAVKHERIELSWKQFEGKKKYLYWNSIEATSDPAGDGEKTLEDVQQERVAMDGESRGRGASRS